MNGGTEWIVDAFGCDAERLQDPAALRRLCEGVIAALALTVIGEPQVHHFGGPGGVTALFLLAESHLACHTYPESQLATFNLYCCREPAAPERASELERGGTLPASLVGRGRSPRGVDWPTLLAEALGATRVMVTTVGRGAGA